MIFTIISGILFIKNLVTGAGGDDDDEDDTETGTKNS